MIFFKFIYPIISICIVIVSLGKLARLFFNERTLFTWFAFVALALNGICVLLYALMCLSINIFSIYKLSIFIIIFSIPICPILISLTTKIFIEYNQQAMLKNIIQRKVLFFIGVMVVIWIATFALLLILHPNPPSIKNIHPLVLLGKNKSFIWAWTVSNNHILFFNIINFISVNLVCFFILYISKNRAEKETHKTIKYYNRAGLFLNFIVLINDIILPMVDIFLLPHLASLIFIILLMFGLKQISKIPQTKILPQFFSLNIFDTLEEAIAFIDLDFKIIYTNEYFKILFEQDLLNKNIKTILPKNFNMENLKKDYTTTLQISTSKKNYLNMKYVVQKDKFGDLLGGVLILQDFTDLMVETMILDYETKNINRNLITKNQQLVKQNKILKSQLNKRNFLQEEYLHLIQFDNLTQAYNRSYFFEYIEKIIKEGKDNFSVFSIDIDNFKYLNDLKGHWLGDLVLIEVVKIVTRFLGDDGIFARTDGDNFLLLHKNISTNNDAIIFSRILSNLISDIKSIGGSEISISISIGVCIYKKGMLADDLVNNAELANLQASFESEKKYVVFNPEISKSISERFQLISEMKKSHEHSEFISYYQPQVLVTRDGNKKIVGYESLVRWQHPERGLLSPYFFIEVAESSGAIVDISYSILRQACQTINYFERKGFDDFKISVNLSAKQVNSESFLNNIKDIFSATNVNTSRLELEITETELLAYNKRIISKCLELKKMGISISIDDFGVGFASFNYIKSLPIDKMKIDKSFVDDIGKNKRTEEIIYIVLEFAKVCNLDIIVEGVEYKHQLDFLLKQNPDIVIQGYYFYKPLPFESILDNKIFPQYEAKTLEVK